MGVLGLSCNPLQCWSRDFPEVLAWEVGSGDQNPGGPTEWGTWLTSPEEGWSDELTWPPLPRPTPRGHSDWFLSPCHYLLPWRNLSNWLLGKKWVKLNTVRSLGVRSGLDVLTESFFGVGGCLFVLFCCLEMLIVIAANYSKEWWGKNSPSLSHPAFPCIVPFAS